MIAELFAQAQELELQPDHFVRLSWQSYVVLGGMLSAAVGGVWAHGRLFIVSKVNANAVSLEHRLTKIEAALASPKVYDAIHALQLEVGNLSKRMDRLADNNKT